MAMDPLHQTRTGRWSSQEHQSFLEALQIFGDKDWKRVSEYVGSRSNIQCRTHAQKHFKRLLMNQQKGKSSTAADCAEEDHTEEGDESEGETYTTSRSPVPAHQLTQPPVVQPVYGKPEVTPHGLPPTPWLYPPSARSSLIGVPSFVLYPSYMALQQMNPPQVPLSRSSVTLPSDGLNRSLLRGVDSL